MNCLVLSQLAPWLLLASFWSRIPASVSRPTRVARTTHQGILRILCRTGQPTREPNSPPSHFASSDSYKLSLIRCLSGFTTSTFFFIYIVSTYFSFPPPMSAVL